MVLHRTPTSSLRDAMRTRSRGSVAHVLVSVLTNRIGLRANLRALFNTLRQVREL
jgi:hypothetical protein